METEIADKKRERGKKNTMDSTHGLLSIYVILYILIGWDDFLSPNSWNIEYSALKILFVLFVIGYVISWKNELALGIIFILWFLGMCYENCFLCASDCGAGIAMGIPLLIRSIFFIINGIRGKRKKSACRSMLNGIIHYTSKRIVTFIWRTYILQSIYI